MDEGEGTSEVDQVGEDTSPAIPPNISAHPLNDEEFDDLPLFSLLIDSEGTLWHKYDSGLIEEYELPNCIYMTAEHEPKLYLIRIGPGT